MAAVGNIEGLSAIFAIGVGVGAVVASAVPGFTGQSLAVTVSLVGLVAAMPLCLLTRDGGRRRVWLSLLFLSAGVLCALSDALPGVSGDGRVMALAGRGAERVRALVDGMGFRDETCALMKALLTGDRSGLRRETVRIFRDAGAAHILALSGLHIGIIYLVFRKLLGLFGKSETVLRVRFVVTLAGAGAFTLAVGAGPSIVRAFLYIAIGETLRLTGRRREPLKVLMLALTVQLALRPAEVRSVGLQLSYAAMLGVAVVYPVLEGWWPDTGKRRLERLDVMRRVWKGLALTLSCQAFAGPVAWWYFRSFPRYFLLTNILAMPLTTVVMVLSVSAVALGAMGICPEVLIRAVDEVVGVLLRVLEIIGTM